MNARATARRSIFNHLTGRAVCKTPRSDLAAAALLNAHHAEALIEGAVELERIADETEARVAEHYGPSSGLGPGSADMVREAARTLRSLAEEKASVLTPTATPGEPTIRLTSQQNAVIIGLAAGESARVTGRRLGVAEATVRTHRRTAYRQLGVDTGAQAVAAAVSHGLLNLAFLPSTRKGGTA